MNKAAAQTRRITLILVCAAAALAQPHDLTPLLPAPTAATQPVREAVLAGDITRASALATSLDPAIKDLWLGILAIVTNDSTGAIRMLRRVDQPKALGVAYYLARQHLLFRRKMEEAIRRNPPDFGSYYYLGRHYDSDVDNPEEAARWFQQALERKPDYALARAYLGTCMERLGRTREAEEAYLASANVAESQLGLARLRIAAGDAEAALQFIRKAIATDARSAKAQKLAARIYTSLNRPGDAVLALESAAALAPHEAAVRYQLFRAYQSSGDSTKAAQTLREFERLRSIYGP